MTWTSDSNIFNISIIMVLVLFGACTTPKVVSHQTPNTDLTKYKTFGVVSGQNFSEDNLQTKDQIEEAVIQEMELRGYQFSLDYDLKVSYQIILSTQTDARTDYQSYPSYSRSNLYESVDVRYYKTGILLIEIRDNKSRKIVWQGSVDMKQNQNSRKKLDLAEFTSMIYATYPILPPNESNPAN